MDFDNVITQKKRLSSREEDERLTEEAG